MVGEHEIVTIRGSFDDGELRAKLNGVGGVELRTSEPGRLVLATAEGRSTELLGAVFGSGVPLSDVSIEPPSLNGLFLKLTGRGLRD